MPEEISEGKTSSKEFRCECGKPVDTNVCSGCKTRLVAAILVYLSPDVDDVWHSISLIRKKTCKVKWHGSEICCVCEKHFVSMCSGCYSGKIRNVIYFYFPQELSDKLISMSQKI